MATPISQLYQRPLTDRPLTEERNQTFEGRDKQLITHLGHFIAWFSACEFMLTLLLHKFAGHFDPNTFHVLTKGMDARKKVETLRNTVKVKGWTIGPSFNSRLDHFEGGPINGLRNKLVHSHLYWPEGGKLQITSIGAPPQYADFKVKGAPAPEKVHGDIIFERALWLRAFSQDIDAIYKKAGWPLTPKGVLQTDRYLSPLPKGNHPGKPRKGPHAK